MAAFDVYVHQDIQEVDVKFVMHVKVIHAWTVVHVNLLTAIMATSVYALVALVDPVVKQVCLFA
jgi:hypothetical protein